MIDGSSSPHRVQEHQSSARWWAGTSRRVTAVGATAQLTAPRISGGGAFWDRAGGTWEPNSPRCTYWGAAIALRARYQQWRWRQRGVLSPEQQQGRQAVQRCWREGILRCWSSGPQRHASCSAVTLGHHLHPQIPDQGSPVITPHVIETLIKFIRK
jgi:hypothetical protein